MGTGTEGAERHVKKSADPVSARGLHTLDGETVTLEYAEYDPTFKAGAPHWLGHTIVDNMSVPIHIYGEMAAFVKHYHPYKLLECKPGKRYLQNFDIIVKQNGAPAKMIGLYDTAGNAVLYEDWIARKRESKPQRVGKNPFTGEQVILNPPDIRHTEPF